MTSGAVAHGIPEILADVQAGARLLWRLPAFLRRPVRLEEARGILRRRLERREADFLDLMRRAVYGAPQSPYRRLLEHAGCAFDDLVRLVGEEGLEGALHTLYRQGVYLTVDEFKGRRAAVRGSATISAGPALLRNPHAVVHIPAQTSGSRGRRMAVGIDLADVRDEAVGLTLFLDARGGAGWVHAYWGVPGGSSVRALLRLAAAGASPRRWFSQVDPAAAGLPRRYAWSMGLVSWGARLAGRSFGPAQHVSPEAPGPIVRWMGEVLRSGRVPHLLTFASAAVRIAQAVLEEGGEIAGAVFTLFGEPVTAARLAAIARVGARAVPYYASVESGHIGYGCLSPAAPDDLHILEDLHAVIQPGPQGNGGSLPAQVLLLTSLRPTAPFVLLNVSSGDLATMAARSCGCPLERLGWTRHMHTIRSPEKLTAGGMTFLDVDVIRVLENVLPGRFGGAPTDYQLVEEEDPNGRPRLRLLVHPAVGEVDPAAVANTFLAALGAGSGAARVMELLWRGAGLLRVERHPPLVAASGKVLHIHQQRREES